MSEYVKIKRRLYDELVETKAKYEVLKQLLETVNKVYEEQLSEKEKGDLN